VSNSFTNQNREADVKDEMNIEVLSPTQENYFKTFSDCDSGLKSDYNEKTTCTSHGRDNESEFSSTMEDETFQK